MINLFNLKKTRSRKLETFQNRYNRDPGWLAEEPQTPFVERFSANLPLPPILEVGCGHGDHSIYLSSNGLDVLGIDFVQSAVDIATKKAEQTGCGAKFEQKDVFDLKGKVCMFNTVVDSGFFHTLDDKSMKDFIGILQKILYPGGIYHMLAFTGERRNKKIPRNITRQDIRTLFSANWQILSIEDADYKTIKRPLGRPSLFATIQKKNTTY